MSGQVQLGKFYKDRISGFTGVAISKTEFLYGCVRVLLEPKGLKEDGSARDSEYFDEQRLIDDSAAESGGPQNVSPPTRADPPR